MLDEFIDELRSPFVYVFASMLLTWCVASSTQIGGSVELEFKAYRLQQYDLLGTPHGSRSCKVMYEAASLDSTALRKCLVVSWRDLLGRDLQTIFGHAVGAVLIVFPANLDTMSPSSRAKFANLERNLMQLSTDMSVYVANEQPELQGLLLDVTTFSKRSLTAVQQIVSSITANTFQLSSTTSVSSNAVVPKSANIVGRLWSSDRNAPTLVLVAHYDSHSAVPALGIGADSNGSGVAALLELLAVLSRFYATATMKPKYNIIFIFTAGGKFNYQGSRQWLEDNMEKENEMNVELVICLDSLGKGEELFAHVSKMPTDTSPIGRMFSRLKSASPEDRSLEIVSKKINLNADTLAWEHERYSIRRLPALTISHFKTHKDLSRVSMLDTPVQLDMQILETNVRTIGEGLWAYMLNLPNVNCSYVDNTSTCAILAKNGVNSKRLAKWIDRYASRSRSMAGECDWLIADLKETVLRYTLGQAFVEPTLMVDISLYGVLEDRLTAHRAKPAVFELLLASIIAIYLMIMYLVVLNIQPAIETIVVKLKKI